MSSPFKVKLVLVAKSMVSKSIPPLSVIEQIAEILQVEPHCFLEPREEAVSFDRLRFAEEASALIAQRSREVLLNLLR